MKNLPYKKLLFLLLLLCWTKFLEAQPLEHPPPFHSYQLGKERMPASTFTPLSDNKNLRLLGHWAYGTCDEVAVVNDTAYFNNGAYLEIVDFTQDPAIKLGKSLLPAAIVEIKVNGNYAYATTKNCLWVIDVSNPGTPQKLGRMLLPAPGYIIVNGNCIYLIDYSTGLWVIDVSNPRTPNTVGYFECRPRPTEIIGDYAYIINNDERLRIISLSNPSNPQQVGSCYTYFGDFEPNLAVSGDYAYVIRLFPGDIWDPGGRNVLMIDISDPTHPSRKNSFAASGFSNPAVVAGSGDFVYIIREPHYYWGGGSVDLVVYDIFNPMDPLIKSSIGLGELSNPSPYSTRYQMKLYDHFAYINDGQKPDWQMIDISEPTSLKRYSYFDFGNNFSVNNESIYDPIDKGLRHIHIGSELEVKNYFPTGGTARSVAVDTSYAYVVGAKLQVLDISSPVNPQQVGYFDLAEFAYQVVVSNAYAYVADKKGLRVIDVNDPSSMHEVGYINTGDYNYDLVVRAAYAYVASGRAGLKVIDISQPTNPYEIGAFDTSGFAEGVALNGPNAYLAANYAGLYVIDISNPANPQKIGYFDTQNRAFDVVVSDTFAYVIDGTYSETVLRVINIASPSNPYEVGHLNTDGYSYAVTVNGDYAYLANGVNGLRVIDVSNHTNPREANYFITGSWACGVTVNDNQIYVADGRDGLYILQNLLAGNPPEKPLLSCPRNNSIIADSTPTLSWQVPADLDKDKLHFKVEIATNSSFSNQIDGSPFRSQNNTTGFYPKPPVAPCSGTCRFTVQNPLPNGDYWWRVTAWDSSFYGQSSATWKFTVRTLEVENQAQLNPAEFVLYANHPNPFNPVTTIAYDLPGLSTVKLTIFNLQGQIVYTQEPGLQPAGRYCLQWNGCNETGQPVASGMYFYRLEAIAKEGTQKSFVDLKKMILMK